MVWYISIAAMVCSWESRQDEVSYQIRLALLREEPGAKKGARWTFRKMRGTAGDGDNEIEGDR